MERGAPLADHFTILGRVAMIREPQHRDADGREEPRCRLVIGFDVAFHKVRVARESWEDLWHRCEVRFRRCW